MATLLDRSAAYRHSRFAPVVSTLRLFPEQCAAGFRSGRGVAQLKRPASIDAIVICGMGGSALGSDILRSVYGSMLSRPLTIVNDYRLPGWVTRRSLVVLSSYSGTTEEVLAAGREARQRGASVTGVTAGGPLAAMLRRWRAPSVRLETSTNPSGQPRMALALSALAQIGMFGRWGFLRVREADIRRLTAVLRRRASRISPAVPTDRNQAKQAAVALVGRLPILIGAGHLVGSMHAFANQLNETAKTYAISFPLPELNHHLLEGLRFPLAARQAAVVTASSSRYDPRIARRQLATARLLRQQGHRQVTIAVGGESALEEALDVAQTTSYIACYLAVLSGVNPLAIPTVDALKRALARPGS